MKTINKTVIALNFPPKNNSHPIDEVDGVNIYTPICGNELQEDCVYMLPKTYKQIFGEKRSVSNCHKRRLSVVKITYSATHSSIYRKYVYNPRFSGMKETEIALHPASIRELGDNDKIVGNEVTVRPGCALYYYWRHPLHATRISAKLGFISVVLALISILLTIILSCHCCH